MSLAVQTIQELPSNCHQLIRHNNPEHNIHVLLTLTRGVKQSPPGSPPDCHGWFPGSIGQNLCGSSSISKYHRRNNWRTYYRCRDFLSSCLCSCRKARRKRVARSGGLWSCWIRPISANIVKNLSYMRSRIAKKIEPPKSALLEKHCVA